MNQKEISELRRRFRPEKNAIGRVYGCYVNGKGEIISYLDVSLGAIPQEEAEQYLELLRKVLSGTPGKNLIDIVFSTQQVMDSEEHRQLMALRDSGLKDAAARESFYQRVIDGVDMEGRNYLILLAHDTYDVPRRRRDGQGAEEDSETVFSYIVCCVCPVKDGKAELGFCPGENEFHTLPASQIVAPPEVGFLFPAFDDRAANLYSALAYAKKPEELHQELLDVLFHVEPPMSAVEQKEAFLDALTGTLGESCDLPVLQAVHEQLTGRILEHKESKDPEPLAVTPAEVGGILRSCGVAEEKVSAFCDSCGERFGQGAVLSPGNLIDSRRFQIQTGEVTLSVAPALSYLVETRVIGGRKYLLVPAEEEVTVNGLPCSPSAPPEEARDDSGQLVKEG